MYALIPYDEVDEYEQTVVSGQAMKGMYTKHKKGMKALLTLPTTVVDFKIDADGNYDSLIEYTCTTKAGIPVTELRFSNRSSDVDTDTIMDMKQTATLQG